LEENFTQDKVVLRDLAVPDLLRQRVLAVVHISEEAERAQTVSDLRCVVFLFKQRFESKEQGYNITISTGLKNM
jgi:hypothetical protein